MLIDKDSCYPNNSRFLALNKDLKYLLCKKCSICFSSCANTS